MPKVLVVATSRKTRGGITSVIKAHETGEQWKKYHCRWIETHRDGNSLTKVFYLLKGGISFLFRLPFYRIVHIHLSEPASALRKSFFFWLAKCFRKKIIVHFHSFSPDSTIRSRYRWLYKFLFCKADRVIVLSEYWKQEVDKEFHIGDNIKVIYNPCPVVSSANVNVQERNGLYVLYAGTVFIR